MVSPTSPILDGKEFLITQFKFLKTVAMQRFCEVCKQRIIFLPIGEICSRVLERGGAERSECPPFPYRIVYGGFTVPSPYHRPTSSSASSDFATKSEDALEEVGRW